MIINDNGMQPAPLDPLAKAVLRALYELAELDCLADGGALAKAVAYAQPHVEPALRAADIARVLLVLDARGLATAARARLTMRGLAEAARLTPLQLERAPWLSALRRQAVQVRIASQHARRPRAAGSGGRA